MAQPRTVYVILRNNGEPAIRTICQNEIFDKEIMKTYLNDCTRSQFSPYRLVKFLEMPDDAAD